MCLTRLTGLLSESVLHYYFKIKHQVEIQALGPIKGISVNLFITKLNV